MKIYLAGVEHGLGGYILDWNVSKDELYLGSFYYFQKQYLKFINNNEFMLDSGAFTFMQNNKIKTDWNEYVEKYAAFINKHNIALFFELDIDSVVGIKEVEKLRKKLEKLTNKRCIPVWHKTRGKEYWLKMIKEYNYVAIGGIVSKEINRKDFQFFPWFIKTAKQQNCKVHGLGFTNLEGLKKYPFYSVDSTSWTTGNRFGAVYWFDGYTMKKQSKKPGQRVIPKKTALHNFEQWLKFSKYARRNL